MIDGSAGTQPIVRTTDRPCPVCGRRSAELLFRQAFQAFEHVGLVDGYDIVACDNCGTAFADGIPTQADFDQYYRELSKYEYEHRGGKESEDDRHRLQETARIVAPMIADRASRILEIGCANGRLLSFFKELGYPNVSGLDPSPGCARSAAALYDVPVATGTIFDLSADHSCDFVILLGVLEHIRDLQPAVRKIRSAVSDGGRVYVEVPDASHSIAQQDAPFQEFSTEHINFFSPRSLQYLMETAGFRTIACTSARRELHIGTESWVASGLFECSLEKRTELPYDSTSRQGLLRYIGECEAIDFALRDRIRQTIAGRTVLVWGVGTHTRRLLANGILRPEQIVAFVDSNPKYQDQHLCGLPVLAPNNLKRRTEPILISSYAFQREISNQIVNDLRLPNELIVLYDQ